MKPFAHHIFAMNNLPTFVGEIDEGFFTRLDIINFEAKFSDVQKEEFDFNNLITENSLDYLANLALRKYLKMRDEKRQKFSNYEESEKMLSIYKENENSVLQFLQIPELYTKSFDKNGYIKKTDFYQIYLSWCTSYKLEIFSKLNFYNYVLSSGNFKLAKAQGGFDCFKIIKKF